MFHVSVPPTSIPRELTNLVCVLTQPLHSVIVPSRASTIKTLDDPEAKKAVISLLMCHVALVIVACLYLFGGVVKKEENPGLAGSPPSKGSPPAKEFSASGDDKGGFSGFIARQLTSAAIANPKAALAVASAAAPTAGALMFGSGAASDSGVKGFYDDDKGETPAYEPPAPAAAGGSGGAVKGAGSSKAAAYGLGASADDVPEANPFMS